MPTHAPRTDGIRSYFEGRAPGWIVLTSDEPVSGIRRTVREGRERMASTILSWIPEEGERRVLDAGCGPGEVSLRMAGRGWTVTGVELAPTLAETARKRVQQAGLESWVTIVEGDAASAPGGPWDHVVLMDVLIHYPFDEALDMVRTLARRCRGSLLFTLAPLTPLLAVMKGVGSLFPRRDRAPKIRPVRIRSFVSELLSDPAMADWTMGRESRVTAGFYFSHAVELIHRPPDGTQGD